MTVVGYFRILAAFQGGVHQRHQHRVPRRGAAILVEDVGEVSSAFDSADNSAQRSAVQS